MILNGIEDFAVRGDLISRSVSLFALRIPEDGRKDEGEFWRAFDTAAPSIFGALLEAVACGLRNVNAVTLPNKPRMADSAKWVAACLPAFGWDYADWWEAYTDGQADAEEAALEGSLPVACLRKWWAATGGTERVMTPGGLYEALRRECPDDKVKFFPANANRLMSDLRRLAPALRSAGIDFHRPDKKQKIGGQAVKPVVVRAVAGHGSRLPAVAGDGFSTGNPNSPAEQVNRERLPVVAGDLRLLEEGEIGGEEGVETGVSGSQCEPPATTGNRGENPRKPGENGLPATSGQRQPTGNHRQPTRSHVHVTAISPGPLDGEATDEWGNRFLDEVSGGRLPYPVPCSVTDGIGSYAGRRLLTWDKSLTPELDPTAHADRLRAAGRFWTYMMAV